MHAEAQTSFKPNRSVVGNDVTITVTPLRVSVEFGKTIDTGRHLAIEIWMAGQLVKAEFVYPRMNYSWSIPPSIDIRKCGIRVKDSDDNVVCELDVEEDLYPFMRPRDEQVHITENYVSVPPALTITDESGAVWTLGFSTAERRQSPEGEFAFVVVRNGQKMGEIASRIERRNGKIRIFTKGGWKVWNGRSFY